MITIDITRPDGKKITLIYPNHSGNKILNMFYPNEMLHESESKGYIELVNFLFNGNNAKIIESINNK